MKNSLFLGLVLAVSAYPQVSSAELSVDNLYKSLEYSDTDISATTPCFYTQYDVIRTGYYGGVLNITYTGTNASFKSITDITSLSGNGNLILEATATNTLNLFRLNDHATSDFRGNLTICNYSNTWDGAGLYDNAAILELGETAMEGSITLDVAGRCNTDTYFIAALGLAGDISIRGLDSAQSISSAAHLYSGTIKENTTYLEHAKELSDYVNHAGHTLTINTGGTHHFHGHIGSGLTIIKKGSGTQSLNGTFAAGNTYRVLGGTLNLTGDAQATEICIENAALNHTGNLTTDSLSMENAQLNISGNLNTEEGTFSGNNTIQSGSVTANIWNFMLTGNHRETPLLTLEESAAITLGTLNVEYDKTQMQRGWYTLVQNAEQFEVTQILRGTQAAQTEIKGNALMFFAEDGELTIPRYEAADLEWISAGGTWKTNSGHAELNWKGPAFNSNFLNGDSVYFKQAAAITLEGELLPAYMQVENATGSVDWSGSGCIGGNASLLKQNTGELRISTANQFSGGTTLKNGTLTTLHSSALGTGKICLQGGTLNLDNQALSNAICICADSNITGGSQYKGELTMENGALRGDELHLEQMAQLHGGEIACRIIGSGGIQVQGDAVISAANSYSGNTRIISGTLTTEHSGALGSSVVIMQGGELNLAYQAVSNKLMIQGNARLQQAGNFCGTIDLQSGSLTTDSWGNAQVSCSGNAVLKAEGTMNLSAPIANTGQLQLEGSFDISALGQSIDKQLVDAYGHKGGNSGFQCDSGTTIRLTSGTGSISGNARFLYLGEEIQLDSRGECRLNASTHLGQYHIGSNHRTSVSDIRAIAGDKLQIITMSGGQLVADTDATISAENATIMLTGGCLSGSCTDSAVTATGGALQISFSGSNQLSATAPVQLRSSIYNHGTLSMLGEFDASLLPLQEQTATRIGGTSAASGFAHSASYSVQVVNGGSVEGNALITHGEHRLRLGSNGTATCGGETDFSEYLLTGNDSARLSEIQHPELQRIQMTGGTFAVDTDTNLLHATAGKVILEAGTFSGSLSGTTSLHITGAAELATPNSHTGGTTLEGGQLTIHTAEALGSGTFRSTSNSKFSVEGFCFTLTEAIQNDGHLILSGSFDASELAQSIASTMVDAYGNEGGDSGFMRDAGCELQLITGGTVNTADADIIVHGQSIATDNTGHVTLPGSQHTDIYHINNNHEVRVSDILRAAGSSLNRIHMKGGTLHIDQSTNTLHAENGLVIVENAHLGGCMSGNTKAEIRGDAVFTTANTHTGGTSISTGSLRITHAQALGAGAVYLGSHGRNATPKLDLSNLPVSNHLYINGNCLLAGTENLTGSITMSEGAEMSIQQGDVLNLNPGQTLTLAPGDNTIHGHINLNGGTVILTGGTLTLNGVAHFSDHTTLDLRQMENIDSELIIFDFPSTFDEELLDVVLPEDMQDNTISFDPETGRLTITDDTPDYDSAHPAPSLSHKLNRNQRSAYEALRRIQPGNTSGELRNLAQTAATSCDAKELRTLMDSVNGAGYTALINSMADDSFAHMQQLRSSAGTGYRLSQDSSTTVLLHAFNHNSTCHADEQKYDYCGSVGVWDAK